MSARLAELCRENPFAFNATEEKLYFNNGPTYNPGCETCKHKVFLSFFFDGTNNKYRDLPAASKGSSNIARLFEACTGSPAEQQPSYGGRKSVAFFPPGIPASEMKFYRKVYIPGLGTAFPDVKDSVEWLKKTGGLAAALYGKERLRWALAQVINQVADVLGGIQWRMKRCESLS
jgi:hypothetical protein